MKTIALQWLYVFIQGGNNEYSLRCELDSAAPGPCVLQSLVVSGSNELGFYCTELEASSDDVLFQLTVTFENTVLKARQKLLQSVKNTFSGIACVDIPKASSTSYRIQLSAISYMKSPAFIEQAEVLSVNLYSENIELTGWYACSTFSNLNDVIVLTRLSLVG
jgi:hypothetical protein